MINDFIRDNPKFCLVTAIGLAFCIIGNVTENSKFVMIGLAFWPVQMYYLFRPEWRKR